MTINLQAVTLHLLHKALDQVLGIGEGAQPDTLFHGNVLSAKELIGLLE